MVASVKARIALGFLAALFILVSPVYAAQVQNCTADAGNQCILVFNLNNGDQVSGSVSVTGGSGNDVNFWITSPTGATVYNSQRVSGGTTFTLSANEAGAYTLHFDNSFSLFSSKQVTVSYDVSTTLIPGSSPVTSYVVVAVVVVLLVALYLALRKRGKKQAP